MKTQKTIFCATLVLLFVLAGPICAYWNVIDLGTLPPGGNSNASSINDNGQIVGGAGQQRACLFDPTGGGANIDLGTFGGPGSAAFSINNSGQIVGWAHVSGHFTDHACIFYPNGMTNKDLGGLPGWSLSWALSINNNCQIVGTATDGSGAYRACLFDPTGGGANRDLGTLGGTYSCAGSINDQGQIVGWAYNSSGYNRACLFDPTNPLNNRDLGTLGGNLSEASSNNDGQIVGSAQNSSGYHRACLFDPTGDANNNINLGTLVGFDYSSASSINNNGQIVGSVFNDAHNINTFRACLFDPAGGGANINLNTLIDPSSGWNLGVAFDISNNGLIVGYGVNPSGQIRAYLLIPEPATVAILGLGGLVLLKKRRS